MRVRFFAQFRSGGGCEERQGIDIGKAVHGPERFAAIKTERAKRIGVGKQTHGSVKQPRAHGKVFDAFVRL